MNIVKRLTTAAVLLPLVYFSIRHFSRLGFFCVIQFVMLAALIEFYSLPRKKKIFPNKPIGVLTALFISSSFYFESIQLSLALFAGLLAVGIFYLISTRKLEDLMSLPSASALTLFGAIYLSFTLNHFTPLRDEFGWRYIFFMMAVIFVGDTGAFLIGKKWGKHKMAAIASPKKTWEGGIAGLVTAGLIGIAAHQVLLKDLVSLGTAVLFSLSVDLIAQISDPIESLFKRAAGVKDSSNLLPGHGGFLDRIDSLILAGPFFYYLLKLFGR